MYAFEGSTYSFTRHMFDDTSSALLHPYASTRHIQANLIEPRSISPDHLPNLLVSAQNQGVASSLTNVTFKDGIEIEFEGSVGLVVVVVVGYVSVSRRSSVRWRVALQR